MADISSPHHGRTLCSHQVKHPVRAEVMLTYLRDRRLRNPGLQTPAQRRICLLSLLAQSHLRWTNRPETLSSPFIHFLMLTEPIRVPIATLVRLELEKQ